MQRTMVGGRYVLGDPLGRGGMGDVYLAHDEQLGREVAVKLLKEQHAENELFIERFRREAKNASSLSHQNIVSVFDAGDSSNGTPYMAMEYVAGGTLGARIEKSAPLDYLEAGGIALQVASALEEAHDKGVVHRDIKPHNIFLVDDAVSARTGVGSVAGPGGVAPGSVKVGDFGIARAAAETAMTETNLILGSVRYLSPEQAAGEYIGPQSDLYSLGAVLYEMLTGEAPFEAENPIAIAMKHVTEAPKPPREVNPGVPEGVQAITLRLLSKAPQERYPDARELIVDLERVGRGLSPLNPATESTEVLELSGPTKTGRTPRRTPGLHPPRFRAGSEARRARMRRRIGGVAVFAILVAGFVVVGAQDGLANLYDGFDAAATERVGGIEDVEASAAVEAPATRVDVPDVVGEEEAAARQTLNDAGFEVEKKARETSEGEAGTVVFQDPRAEGREQRGSTVQITVAKAPATATVPDLTGLDVGEAKDRLSGAGLSLGGQDEAVGDSIAAGLILSQGPTAGTELDRGAAVGITVSLGPDGPEPVASPTPSPEPTPAPAPATAPAQPGATVPEAVPEAPTPTPDTTSDPTQGPATEPTPEPAQKPVTEPAPTLPPQQEQVPGPDQQPAQQPTQQPQDPAPVQDPVQDPDQQTAQQPSQQAPGQTPEQPSSEPGSSESASPESVSPGGSDPAVPVTPEPVDPVTPDVLGN